jgi:hypothetical protein
MSIAQRTTQSLSVTPAFDAVDDPHDSWEMEKILILAAAMQEPDTRSPAIARAALKTTTQVKRPRKKAA